MILLFEGKGFGVKKLVEKVFLLCLIVVGCSLWIWWWLVVCEMMWLSCLYDFI